MNYQARTGILALTAGADGSPGVPATLAGDIAGGTYPAVVNLLLALRRRDRTGEGCFIDIAMAENLFTFQFLGLAMDRARRPGHGPAASSSRGARLATASTAPPTGATSRSPPSRTSSGRRSATLRACPKRFETTRATRRRPSAVGGRLRGGPRFGCGGSGAGRPDTCCTVVRTLEEAVRDLHFKARGVFERRGRDFRPRPAGAAPSPGPGASHAGGGCTGASRRTGQRAIIRGTKS